MATVLKNLSPADRLTAQRYADDMVKAARESDLDRAALVLAAGRLATLEGRHVGTTFPAAMAHTTKQQREGATR